MKIKMIKAHGIALEVPCWQCTTLISDDTYEKDDNCDRCGGTGSDLTAEGKQFMSFIGRHLLAKQNWEE